MIPQEMMILVKRAGRSFGAALFGSLAVLTGAASCVSSEPATQPPEGGAGKTMSGAGQGQAGTTTGSAGMHQSGGQGGSGGSSSTGGSGGSVSSTGGSGGFVASGGTGTAGMNTAGTSTAGGFGTGGTSPTGGAAGKGAMSGAGGGAGTFGAMGGRGGASAGRNAGGAAGKGAGGMSGAAGSTSSAGSGFGANGGVAPPADISGGTSGWASRYWDCCKPACGWTSHTNGKTPAKTCNQQDQSISDPNAQNACVSGGTAFMCWSGAPWAVGDQLSYGFVAGSDQNFTCGRCYHLQFTGTSNNGDGMSTPPLNGKHMIVQVINTGGIASNQLDLLLPGGGVGQLNACDTQFSGKNLGDQYGGMRTTCKGDKNCILQMCQAAYGSAQDMLDGCEWFVNWYNAADNPNFTMKQIACPSDITSRSGLADPG
jgi:hypothetical protein